MSARRLRFMGNNIGKIKVLHAHASLRTGGIAVLLYNYYSKMNHEKIVFDHIISVADTGMIGKKFIEEGSVIYHLPRFRRIISTFLGTRKAIKEGNYKIVHVHHTQKSFVQLFAAWTCGVPVRIAHSHNYYTNEKVVSYLLNRIYSFLTRLFATDYFACSDLAGEYVFGREKDKHTFKKIYNAIDIPNYIFDRKKRDIIRSELNIQNNYVICNVGRLTIQKNPFRLVDIFEKVKSLNNRAKLMWIGTGELEDSIKQYVVEKNLNNDVLFIGETDRVYDYLQACDLFFFPSLYEGLGIVLVEAQVTGLPCIVSDVVPSEVKLTPTVVFKSLSCTNSEWARTILSYENYERKDYSKEIIQAGYNLKDKAEKLQRWYLMKGNEK